MDRRQSLQCFEILIKSTAKRLMYSFYDILVGIGSKYSIHLRDLGLDLFLVALCKTSGYDQSL